MRSILIGTDPASVLNVTASSAMPSKKPASSSPLSNSSRSESPDALERRSSSGVLLLAVGRGAKHDAGQHVERQFQRPEQIGIDGEPVLVGGDASAVSRLPSANTRPPALPCATQRPQRNQISDRERALLLADGERQLPSCIDGDEFRREPVYPQQEGHGRCRRRPMQCTMQIEKCKMQM